MYATRSLTWWYDTTFDTNLLLMIKPSPPCQDNFWLNKRSLWLPGITVSECFDTLVSWRAITSKLYLLLSSAARCCEYSWLMPLTFHLAKWRKANVEGTEQKPNKTKLKRSTVSFLEASDDLVVVATPMCARHSNTPSYFRTENVFLVHVITKCQVSVLMLGSSLARLTARHSSGPIQWFL